MKSSFLKTLLIKAMKAFSCMLGLSVTVFNQSIFKTFIRCRILIHWDIMKCGPVIMKSVAQEQVIKISAIILRAYKDSHIYYSII